MGPEEFFHAVEVGHEVDGLDALEFAQHLGAMMLPLVNEMFLAIIGLEQRHDFMGWEGAQV